MTRSLEKGTESWMYAAMLTGAVLGAVAGNLTKPYLEKFVSYMVETTNSLEKTAQDNQKLFEEIV